MKCPRCEQETPASKLERFSRLCPPCLAQRNNERAQRNMLERAQRNMLLFVGAMLVGALLFIGGVIGTVYFFFFFDTTVTTERDSILGRPYGGNTFHNIGLMAERQNGLIFSIAAAGLGAVMFSAGHFMIEQSKPKATTQLPQPKLCPQCGKYYAEASAFCPHCGKPQSQTAVAVT